MLGLMLLIKPRTSEAQSGRRSWTSSQQEELQLQALAALTSLAPLMLDDYMTCQANTCLLLLLDWCLQEGTASSSALFQYRVSKRSISTLRHKRATNRSTDSLFQFQ